MRALLACTPTCRFEMTTNGHPPRNDHPDIQCPSNAAMVRLPSSSCRHLRRLLRIGPTIGTPHGLMDGLIQSSWLMVFTTGVLFFFLRRWCELESASAVTVEFRDEYSSTTPILPDPCRSSQFVGKTARSLQLDHLGSRTSRAPETRPGPKKGLFQAKTRGFGMYF